jgi:hypothetical protein
MTCLPHCKKKHFQADAVMNADRFAAERTTGANNGHTFTTLIKPNASAI